MVLHSDDHVRVQDAVGIVQHKITRHRRDISPLKRLSHHHLGIPNLAGFVDGLADYLVHIIILQNFATDEKQLIKTNF